MKKEKVTTTEVMEAEALMEEENLSEETEAKNKLVEETEENEQAENAPAAEEDKDSDDEFMEDLYEEPITPEKAKKKIESLNVMIENCQKTVDSLHDLAEANKSGALSILKEKIKENLTSLVDEEDPKEIKAAANQLDSVKFTLGLIGKLCMQYSCALSDIRKYKEQIADIEAKCRQLQLPFGENSETEKETQEEEEFMTRMYHIEEYESRLDGEYDEQ